MKIMHLIIIQLEQENKSLKLKIQEQSNEINDLKLRLNNLM